MWTELPAGIFNAILFMLDKPQTADCHDFLVGSTIELKFRHTDLIDLNINVTPQIFKQYEEKFVRFKGIIQHAFHQNHRLVVQSIDMSSDWSKLEILSSKILPTTTPWEEINNAQNRLIKQAELANDVDSFRNVGNTARHLLQQLAKEVFDATKHIPMNNTRNLGDAAFKNRLWAFVLYKVPAGSGNDSIKDYIETILDSSDKAIDLSNTTTHELNANALLAQSCAISTITTVHLVKLVNEMPDPT